jgi:dihydrofolate reductase
MEYTMRKVIVSNLVSLDGFFEGPNKELDWFVIDPEFLDYAKDLLRGVDTLLFGAVTYEHMANYWPSAPADEIADNMNTLLKIVFSRTLERADWNNSRLVTDNILAEVSTLKSQPGKDMAVLGSARLAALLMQHGLVDEYRVLLQPILLGSGNPLFKAITARIPLQLMAAKPFGSGVVLLSYKAL